MKKIVYIVLAVLIIAGIIVTATIGLNVDVIYKAHEEVNIYIGKEVDIKEIESIVKEVFGNQKTIVSEVELFHDMFIVKTKTVSEEQIESLKQKVGEKYEIEDISNMITTVHIPKLKLRDLIKPYVWPIVISTVIILVFMAIRYKKLGSIKVVLQTGIMVVLAELLLLSIIAITRYPVNRYIVPAGITVYIATIVAANIELVKNLEEKKDKEEDKKEEL